jgi:hypothetical protein
MVVMIVEISGCVDFFWYCAGDEFDFLKFGEWFGNLFACSSF